MNQTPEALEEHGLEAIHPALCTVVVDLYEGDEKGARKGW